MRNLLLFLTLCLLATFQSVGQSRPDKIYQLDKTFRDAYVEEIGEKAITYFLPTDTRQQIPQKILKSQVWKIVFANGDEEVINPLPAEPDPIARPDRIFTTSNTIVEAKVLRIGQTAVEYRKLDGGTDSPVFELPLQKISRIELADGSVRSFAASETAGSDKKSAKNSDETLAGRKGVSRNLFGLRELWPIKARSSSDQAEGRRLGVSAAFVGSYVYRENYWRSKSKGLGLEQGLGGTLTIQYKALDWMAIFLEGGYNQFLSNRGNYRRPGNDTLRTGKYILRTIPVQLGVKVYLPGHLYLGVSGGVNYLISSFELFDDNLSNTTRFSPVGTAALGVEPRIGKLKLNIAVQYTYTSLIATSQYDALPALHTPQIKLGIGF